MSPVETAKRIGRGTKRGENWVQLFQFGLVGASGYIVNLTKEQLQSAPADEIDQLTKNDGDGLRDSVYDYYKAPRYWS